MRCPNCQGTLHDKDGERCRFCDDNGQLKPGYIPAFNFWNGDTPRYYYGRPIFEAVEEMLDDWGKEREKVFKDFIDTLDMEGL